MNSPAVPIPSDALVAFAKRWRVAELSLFGSVLRSDFSAQSDVDVLVAFEPGVSHDLDGWLAMRDELSAIFGGREIDLVERRLVTNPFRRHEIISTRRVVYAA